MVGNYPFGIDPAPPTIMIAVLTTVFLE